MRLVGFSNPYKKKGRAWLFDEKETFKWIEKDIDELSRSEGDLISLTRKIVRLELDFLLRLKAWREIFRTKNINVDKELQDIENLKMKNPGSIIKRILNLYNIEAREESLEKDLQELLEDTEKLITERWKKFVTEKEYLDYILDIEKSRITQLLGFLQEQKEKMEALGRLLDELLKQDHPAITPSPAPPPGAPLSNRPIPLNVRIAAINDIPIIYQKGRIRIIRVPYENQPIKALGYIEGEGTKSYVWRLFDDISRREILQQIEEKGGWRVYDGGASLKIKSILKPGFYTLGFVGSNNVVDENTYVEDYIKIEISEEVKKEKLAGQEPWQKFLKNLTPDELKRLPRRARHRFE